MRRGAPRRRMMWTPELHTRFLNAVNHLGTERAVPKTILALMNVEGLTRENVASHLQKYRAYLRRISGLPPGAHLPHASLAQGALDSPWGGSGSYHGAFSFSNPAAAAAARFEMTGEGEAAWAEATGRTGEGAAGAFVPRHAAPPPQHLLSTQAAPIQPLDVSAALVHQPPAVRAAAAAAGVAAEAIKQEEVEPRASEGGASEWGPMGASLASMGYAGLLGVPQTELPVFGPALAASAASLTAGWHYPPLPPHLQPPAVEAGSTAPQQPAAEQQPPGVGPAPEGTPSGPQRGASPSAVTRQLRATSLDDQTAAAATLLLQQHSASSAAQMPAQQQQLQKPGAAAEELKPGGASAAGGGSGGTPASAVWQGWPGAPPPVATGSGGPGSAASTPRLFSPGQPAPSRPAQAASGLGPSSASQPPTLAPAAAPPAEAPPPGAQVPSPSAGSGASAPAAQAAVSPGRAGAEGGGATCQAPTASPEAGPEIPLPVPAPPITSTTAAAPASAPPPPPPAPQGPPSAPEAEDGESRRRC
mmetsp:Transcript_12114/g.36342  ORF Transcript_12114/g.36342 Transcript_12114/m.36342 type:complete len:531 (-) Transcript_12114:2592-4184(-)